MQIPADLTDYEVREDLRETCREVRQLNWQIAMLEEGVMEREEFISDLEKLLAQRHEVK
jgi:predicted RNase H-like nuclease (RuvC/YqgF family)